jgi:hypothetical protein
MKEQIFKIRYRTADWFWGTRYVPMSEIGKAMIDMIENHRAVYFWCEPVEGEAK